MYNVNAGGDSIKIDLNNEYNDVDLSYSFTEEECEKAGILKLDDLKISGYIKKNGSDHYIDLSLDGEMTLTCDLTLEPVSQKIDVKIDGNVQELTENIINMENSIDIFPIVWENVLVEIPMKVVSEKPLEKTEGEGWKLITEEDNNENEFSKLKDIF